MPRPLSRTILTCSFPVSTGLEGRMGNVALAGSSLVLFPRLGHETKDSPYRGLLILCRLYSVHPLHPFAGWWQVVWLVRLPLSSVLAYAKVRMLDIGQPLLMTLRHLSQYPNFNLPWTECPCTYSPIPTVTPPCIIDAFCSDSILPWVFYNPDDLIILLPMEALERYDYLVGKNFG